MKTAVVILNWNGKFLLEQFLPSVVAHSAGADIYVIDNASSDGSIEYVEAQFPQVKIICNGGNYGYAQGYNEGLKHIDADLFCLINSDVEVTQGWLSPIVEVFERQVQVGIVQPKIRSYNDKKQFEYAGAAGGYVDKYGYPFCRGRLFDTLENDTGQYDSTEKIFWASGACFFIRKEIFENLEGFDVDFFAHQEEIDLCWRAQNNGYKVLCVPQSTVYHLGGATLTTGSFKKVYLNFRNSLFMLLKNLPASSCFWVISVRMLLDGVAGVRFLLQGNFSSMWAIVRAHFSFYAKLRHFYKKRQGTAKKVYFRVSSVVYLYYIKGIRKFSEL